MNLPDTHNPVDVADPPWPSWVEVDLDAIGHNVGELRALVGPSCRVMAVVKAQGYGHGAVAVAGAAVRAGAAWLAVARAREGVQLREAGFEEPILLLGPAGEAETGQLVRSRLTPTVANLEQATAISAAAAAEGVSVPVHLNLDTGMSRYGIPLEEMRALLPRIASLAGLQLEGLYSHFATADDPDGSFARAQLQSFLDARRQLELDGFRFPLVHMAASGGTLALEGSHFDLVRAGISLYGLYPAPHLESRAALRPALSLRSRVAHVCELQPGQSVGYGRTFVAPRRMTAALVLVGYADGLPRSHSNRGSVLINDRRAPLIGRVSMDQCVVDVGDCGPVGVGDAVVLIGSQGEARISCEDFAAISGTINYEVVTGLGFRLPRLYVRGGRAVGVAYLDVGRTEFWASEGERMVPSP